MQYTIGIITGALLLIGSLFILGVGKHDIDQATQEISLSVPILGRIKTQSRIVFFAAVGFALIIACYKLQPKNEELISVNGTIDTTTPVTVYFVAVPRAQYQLQVSRDLHAQIPKIDNADYIAEFVIDKKVVDEKLLTVTGGQASFKPFSSRDWNSGNGLDVVPNVKVSDAAAKEFLK